MKSLKGFWTVVLIIGIVFATLSYGISVGRNRTINFLPVPLLYQHKDSFMQCILCNSTPHLWNDTKGPDGKYGTQDDCPHCSAYCAPASIAMISAYYSQYYGDVTNHSQDVLYDIGKQSDGETQGDGIIQTHGVGMYDGTGGHPQEVQTAFRYALGNYTQYGGGNSTITGDVVIQAINNGQPILWLDHNGWPTNISEYLPGWLNMSADQGHAKVIIGYDDNGTPLNYSDDWYLINDPWPEYTDKGILPLGAKLGPGNTTDPYWIPSSAVLNNTSDIEIISNRTVVISENIPLFAQEITIILILIAVPKNREE